MTEKEALKNVKEELFEISEECVREGYPSRGSNFCLRAESAKEFWIRQIPGWEDWKSSDAAVPSVQWNQW